MRQGEHWCSCIFFSLYAMSVSLAISPSIAIVVSVRPYTLSIYFGLIAGLSQAASYNIDLSVK